tara:strand:+ start:67 stop:528 length:462 start_codon:yes stop_codon:yes gene_type:complete
MRKATRQLLKYLKKSNPNAFAIVVKPLRFEKAKTNYCFENAMRFLDENEDWVLRSGWLIGEYFGENGTAIMPHYWVYNPQDKTDYDITPFDDDQTFEYVLDLEIAKTIDEQRKLSVPVSLKLYDDGTLNARTGANEFLELTEINYNELYNLVD